MDWKDVPSEGNWDAAHQCEWRDVLSDKHPFDSQLRTELNLLPYVTPSPSSLLHYLFYHSVFVVLLLFVAVMIQFPMRGHVITLFLCCSWKRICTIRVSWDCVCIFIFFCFSRHVCSARWEHSNKLRWHLDILAYIDILLPHYIKKIIQFEVKLYIIHTKVSAFLLWH